MWENRVTKLLGTTYPIIQGGLAYLAYSELASAVSNAGGLGQITAMSLPSPEALKEEIRKVRQRTKHSFGVNFAIGHHGRSYELMLETAIEQDVPVISMTGGNPAPLMKKLENTKIKKVVLVASTRQAQKAEALGADAVMVVGQEGGGHLGKADTGTIVLVPQVVDAVSIPVIASGGIGDGRGLMAALALGAEGIEMGTRFIVTKECVHAHPNYKKNIITATENDTTVIKRSIGSPARALKNKWTNKILDIEKVEPTYDALKEYISGDANKSYIYEGNEDEGFGWAGQIVGRIHEELTVSQLLTKIINEAQMIRKQWVVIGGE
ncbi:NAD(P)H-dependent flavin oxidoreductase [Halalkalibacter alkaliphilus]|uniref:Probable nitronate monooxygenase n=1 Tax=Halalkalibacter alkaliphilus TaxID=2917993 RepID=A0A9X2A3R3_9BACI|nr:nitronate monooxygenase family protein [Halalkalibacter alkaliphilus]MCL7746312.1 nitronate monooxygenase family protein [Halalkalibacter alkaliphilus]